VLERHPLRLRPMATIRAEESDGAFVAISEIEGKRFESQGDSAVAAIEAAIGDLLVEQPPGRPPLGPGTTGKYERELSALDGLGLDDVVLDATLAFVLGFARGAARDVLATRAAHEAHGDDAQWWAEREATLAELMPAERYPLAVRVGAAVGAVHDAAWDAPTSFEFGLARVVDGLVPVIEGS